MTDIFEGGDQKPEDKPTVSEPIVETATLDSLVGADKKFKSVEALAQGKLSADEHITHLEDELAEERKINKEKATAEELLQRQQQKSVSNESREATPPTLTDADITKLVENVITNRELDSTKAANIKSANDKAISFYGGHDKAVEAVNAKAQELGLSVEGLMDVASKSPTAFKNLMGISQSNNPSTGKLGEGSINLEGELSNGQPKAGTKEYFTALRKEKGNEAYFKDHTIRRQEEQAIREGTY